MAENEFGVDEGGENAPNDEQSSFEDPNDPPGMAVDPASSLAEQQGILPGMEPHLSPAELGFNDLSEQAELENMSDGQDLAEEMMKIDPRNYALAASVTDRFREDILDKLPQIEEQRQPLETLWSECEDIWARKNNAQSRYYTGINDAYMPTGFRALETHVQHLMADLFPLQFACIPKKPDMMAMMLAEKANGILTHDAEQAELETLMENAIRQSFIYGWFVEYTGWKEESKRNYRMMIDKENELVAAAGAQRIKTYAGPTFEVLDPYDIYIHPYDVTDIKKAEIVHQYIRTDIRKLRKLDAEQQNNPRLPFLGVDEIPDNMPASKAKTRQGEERKNIRNEKYSLRHDQITNKYERIATRIYCKFDLYDTGDIVDCKATVIDGQIIELRQNPLKDQTPPYRIWSPFNTTRHIYKMGMCEIMKTLVYILNAIINQMLDANLFQTNMMMAIDVNRYEGRPSDIEISPFNVFAFGGQGPVKDAIQFMKPEMNLQQTLLAGNVVASTIQDSVAASAAIQGKYSSKERTKGEVDTVTAAAMTGVSSMVRSLSKNLIAKWLEDALELESQFRDPEDEFNITGMPPFKMPYELRTTKFFVKILTTPEVQAYQQAQAMAAASAQDQTATGGEGDTNSNPEGVNSPGGMNPESMGAGTFGNDQGAG